MTIMTNVGELVVEAYTRGPKTLNPGSKYVKIVDGRQLVYLEEMELRDILAVLEKL